ncbi:MAG TPA: glycoside hydrolase family 19 protein [Myxococcaceae bacterium]|nr:glycoside hydrolase family 19 protein [Myxococcaceae bacterium]
MPISLTPGQLKAIVPEAPASAVLTLNSILARTSTVTHLRAAMLVSQLATSSRGFRLLAEKDGGPRPRAPYFGRGWIHLTGRRAYREAAEALDLDLVRNPDLVLLHNTEVTAWFWNAHRLHRFSDDGDVDGCVRAISGDSGRPEALSLARTLYHRACFVLAGAHELAA